MRACPVPSACWQTHTLVWSAPQQQRAEGALAGAAATAPHARPLCAPCRAEAYKQKLKHAEQKLHSAFQKIEKSMDQQVGGWGGGTEAAAAPGVPLSLASPAAAAAAAAAAGARLTARRITARPCPWAAVPGC
jgi:hypothetical protein